MSEYVEIETFEQDDPHQLLLMVNMTLSDDGEEVYSSADEMAEGSTLANALSIIPGIEHLTIGRHSLLIERDPFFEWYTITEDVRAVIVDFFL